MNTPSWQNSPIPLWIQQILSPPRDTLFSRLPAHIFSPAPRIARDTSTHCDLRRLPPIFPPLYAFNDGLPHHPQPSLLTSPPKRSQDQGVTTENDRSRFIGRTGGQPFPFKGGGRDLCRIRRGKVLVERKTENTRQAYPGRGTDRGEVGPSGQKM